jgi:5-methylcytosine-specific restriction enzyme subunit McrC
MMVDVDQADIYQVMAYARIYGCERTVLLYPGHDGLVSPMPIHHRVGQIGGPVRITIAKVDVSSHDAALAGLSALVAQVLNWGTQADN